MDADGVPQAEILANLQAQRAAMAPWKQASLIVLRDELERAGAVPVH